MAILFRVLLISLVVYLVVKLVRDSLSPPGKQDNTVKPDDRSRKVSKDVGEYVDFEETDKDKGRTTKDEGRRGESSDKEQRAGSRESSRVSDKKSGTRDFR